MPKYISFVFPYSSVDVVAERLFLKYLTNKLQDTLHNFFMNTNKLLHILKCTYPDHLLLLLSIEMKLTVQLILLLIRLQNVESS